MTNKLIGPFSQAITMEKLSLKGALQDDALCVVENAGIVTHSNGTIVEVGNFSELFKTAKSQSWEIDEIQGKHVALPGLIDCHTHLCWGGDRARDYSMRIAGKSYLEIAKQGGGIIDTVEKTREASTETLEQSTLNRCKQLLNQGITTVEAKSGYGLSKHQELRILEVIQSINNKSEIDIVSTCLAAHMKPKDFDGSQKEYLDYCLKEILPEVKSKNLSNRIDIFVEESAFTIDEARDYLKQAKQMGYDITLHVDQFTAGSSLLAVEFEAKSADHLEASTDKEITALANSNVVAVALPGASIGLGCAFTPARKLLDQGASLAIASDWNPGSAPMGDLLTQAAILSAFEKLSNAETLAGMSIRAAKALGLEKQCGSLEKDKLCDLAVFPTHDYRQILYHQGSLKCSSTWKKGLKVNA